MFADAARGKTGMDALHAMGEAYETVMADRDRLMLMLKCWASCDDPEICEAVRGAWRDLVDLAERASGESPEAVSTFFSKGALLTILMGDGGLHPARAVVEPPHRGLPGGHDRVGRALFFSPDSK